MRRARLAARATAGLTLLALGLLRCGPGVGAPDTAAAMGCASSVCATSCTGNPTSATALGCGKDYAPFLICNASQLADLARDPFIWSYAYKLMADLDLSGMAFTPIGNSTLPFSGSFDGNGHSLSNLNYSAPSKDNVGLFGVVNGTRAWIKNLVLNNFNITGLNRVGTLAGSVQSATVLFTRANSGLVTTFGTWGGGLIGHAAWGSMIASSSAKVTLTGMANGRGGLIGYSRFSVITNSFATGNVNGLSASPDVGGLQGIAVGGTTTFTNSFYSGTPVNSGGGGLSADPSGVNPVAASTFLLSTHAPLSSWNFNQIWTQAAGVLPVPAPLLFDRSSWDGCSKHATQTPFAGGYGTLEFPYLICNANQLKQLMTPNTYWAQHYGFLLLADVDLQVSSSCNTFGTSKPLTDFMDAAKTPTSAWDFGRVWKSNSGALPTLRVWGEY